VRPMAMKRYELRADLYYSTFEQNPDSGAFETIWHWDDPRVIKATGRSVRPWGSVEDFGEGYKYQDYLQLFVPEQVPLTGRVSNVRTKNGDIIWMDDKGKPTLFDIYGCFPEKDGNGRVVDYKVLLARAGVDSRPTT
jgi:hypothetical protein